MGKQIILRHTIHKSPRNDCKDFKPLLKEIKTTCVTADKGYDSYKNHEFIFTQLKAKSMIKQKKTGKPKKGKSFSYRNKARNDFNEQKYHQRSKIETIFSVIKRKYDSRLKAKTFNTQKKEIICKLITYNIDRIIKFHLLLLRVSAEPAYLEVPFMLQYTVFGALHINLVNPSLFLQLSF